MGIMLNPNVLALSKRDKEKWLSNFVCKHDVVPFDIQLRIAVDCKQWHSFVELK